MYIVGRAGRERDRQAWGFWPPAPSSERARPVHPATRPSKQARERKGGTGKGQGCGRPVYWVAAPLPLCLLFFCEGGRARECTKSTRKDKKGLGKGAKPGRRPRRAKQKQTDDPLCMCACSLVWYERRKGAAIAGSSQTFRFLSRLDSCRTQFYLQPRNDSSCCWLLLFTLQITNMSL